MHSETNNFILVFVNTDQASYDILQKYNRDEEQGCIHSFQDLDHGSMIVFMDKKREPSVRLQKIKAGAFVGEIGVYLNEKRGATIIAEVDSSVRYLEKAKLKK